jgi:hypothetical protein
MNYNSVNTIDTNIPFIDDDENTNWSTNDDLDFFKNAISDPTECSTCAIKTDPIQASSYHHDHEDHSYTVLNIILDLVQCILFYLHITTTIALTHIYHLEHLHSFALTSFILTVGMILRIFISIVLKYTVFVNLKNDANTSRILKIIKFHSHLAISILNFDNLFW